VVPANNTIELDMACKKYGVDHRYTLYPGVNHSFIWPGDKYNRKAHLDSWNRTLKFLKKSLSQGGGK
jgi:dienelactone hydrolase